MYTCRQYGYAAGSFTYQYVDLWSRRSTWGGNLPPVDGDSVYIPAGTNVMLDVSPPRLNLVVVEGNLVFDTSVNANIWLQVGAGLVLGSVLGGSGFKHGDDSPPRLNLVVVEGNLVFDTSVNANIWLQVGAVFWAG